MESKGRLTKDGRVTQALNADTIGAVYLKESQRRFTRGQREWVVILDCGARKFSAPTRRGAVALAIDWWRS